MSRGKVLVTGGAGYIGSHACKALATAGFDPVVLDSLVHGHREAVRWGPFEQGDLLDLDRVRQVFESHDFVGVMHFAAFIAVGESVVEPGRYYRNNVGGTLNLLNAMGLYGVRHIIFSSTAAVYGTPEAVPIPETAKLAPINPYGHSKLMSEQIIADHSTAQDLAFVALRYFNAAGADLDCEAGEDHDPETHLIPLALDAVAQGRPIKVFGEDYPTADGTCIRDYIHVADLADAHVAALQHLLRGGDSMRFNLGTGTGASVREIVETVSGVVGRALKVEVAERRPGDPPSLVADARLAREQLEWAPRKSDLRTIVSSAWAWHQRRK